MTWSTTGAPPGQAVEPLSAHSDAVSEWHHVQTRDGARLATDVYLPSGVKRAPAVLIRTPYDKGARAGFKPQTALYLAEHGYAAIVQDVRGRGRSDGMPRPYVHEALDGYDTVEWIAAQPWCDGAVAMMGGSYTAYTQWAAAAAEPPALRAIVPDGIAVACDYPMRFQGVPWLMHYRWFVDTWTFPTSIKTEAWGWTERPLLASIPAWATVGREKLEAWIGGPSDSAYHLGRLLPAGLPTRRLRIPALHTTGWWDAFARFGMLDWQLVSTQAPAARHQYLRLHAADHHYPYIPDGVAPDDHWGTDDRALERLLPELLGEPIAFLDHYVRRNDSAAPPLARVQYSIANGPTGSADRWPPAGAEEQVLYLTAAHQANSSADGGGLSPVPDGAPQPARWVHDPGTPVPSLAEDEWDLLFGAHDQAVNHRRPDVLTFTSDAVDQPLDLCGPLGTTLFVESLAPSSHVMAELSEVAPGGRAQLIAYGASHVQFDDGSAMVGVDLGLTGYRVRPGHRLRLAVSASMFPRFAVHPGYTDDPLLAADHRSISLALRVGGSSGSRLRVTVLKVA